TRRGIGVDLKKIYSRKSELDAGLLYSDESPRGDSLRGTVVSDVFEPSVDTNRFGGHLSYRWSSGRNLLLPVSLLADGRYVSDPLFLREIENYKIGRPEDRFLSSKAIVSAPLGDYMNLQLRVEGTQSISSDTDLVFMRVPELTLDGYRSFRVFGINPYGLKLIGSGDITVTRFARKKGFDGTRVEAHPAVKLPFYYKNYLSGDIGFNVRRTYYTLNERADPNNPQTILPSTSSRTIYETAINLSTVLERVFELGKGNLLRRLGAIGVRGEYNDIVRVKHTLEPFVQFVYVPDVNQDDTPLFDANDHLKGRKVVTYGIESFLIGRRRYIAEKEGKISELEPDERELMEDIFEDYPSNAVQEVDESFILRRKKGEKGQIAKFSIKQSYDRMVDASAGSNRFSDINGTVEFRPNHYMGFMFGSNYDYNDGGFSSWGADVELSDDRGDHLRGRVTSVRDVVSQFEGNVELVFSKRMKVGFYGKYDDLTGEFIEWKGVVRILSGCDCWKLDIGYREQLNPDDQDLTIVLTLKGLGEIG
ncbi:MAG: LPS-assembly protein LptD, partial [Candidatus Dadabacteria bacterium]